MDESARRRPVHVYALAATACVLFVALTVQTLAGGSHSSCSVVAQEVAVTDLTPATISIEIDHERLQARQEEINRKLERLNSMNVPAEIPRIIIHRR